MQILELNLMCGRKEQMKENDRQKEYLSMERKSELVLKNIRMISTLKKRK